MTNGSAVDGRWTIIFDGDGTLWRCSEYYQAADLACATIIHTALPGLDMPDDQLIRYGRFVQAALFERRGFYFDLFQDAWEEAYAHLAARLKQPIDPIVGASIQGAFEVVRSAPYPLFEGVAETLAKLKTDGHQLHLLTLGDREFQLLKVRRNGIEALFDSIHPVQEPKGPQLRLLGLGGFAGRAMMVGDSLDSDVRPALRLGIVGVWLRNAGLPWLRTKRFPRGARFHTIERVAELPRLIDQLNSAERPHH
ncbi:MAG: HAD family hydrolase [Candidatus Kerfeldbacteria bacterium]|nr:HAD family hydrolase [Candidatus Kerfeldbacteria bacterium]